MAGWTKTCGGRQFDDGFGHDLWDLHERQEVAEDTDLDDNEQDHYGGRRGGAEAEEQVRYQLGPVGPGQTQHQERRRRAPMAAASVGASSPRQTPPKPSRNRISTCHAWPVARMRSPASRPVRNDVPEKCDARHEDDGSEHAGYEAGDQHLAGGDLGQRGGEDQ